MLLALAAVWGGSFFFNAVAVRDLPVFTVVVARVALGALLLLAILRLTGQRMPTGRRVWAAFLGMGLLNNAIPFSLIVWGQQHIASGVGLDPQRLDAAVHGDLRALPDRRREDDRRAARSGSRSASPVWPS